MSLHPKQLVPLLAAHEPLDESAVGVGAGSRERRWVFAAINPVELEQDVIHRPSICKWLHYPFH